MLLFAKLLLTPWVPREVVAAGGVEGDGGAGAPGMTEDSRSCRFSKSS